MRQTRRDIETGIHRMTPLESSTEIDHIATEWVARADRRDLIPEDVCSSISGWPATPVAPGRTLGHKRRG